VDQTLTAELDIWQVMLTTDGVVEVAAHGVAARGGCKKRSPGRY
jgi:hypothetical protein